MSSQKNNNNKKPSGDTIDSEGPGQIRLTSQRIEAEIRLSKKIHRNKKILPSTHIVEAVPPMEALWNEEKK